MAWSPHSEDPAKSMTPDLLGTHQDYVRCLAHSRDLGWVVSGGLDRKIKIWDVMEGRETSIGTSVRILYPNAACVDNSALPSLFSVVPGSHAPKIIDLLACGEFERYDPGCRHAGEGDQGVGSQDHPKDGQAHGSHR